MNRTWKNYEPLTNSTKHINNVQGSKLIALNHEIDKLIIFVKNGQVPKYLKKNIP